MITVRLPAILRPPEMPLELRVDAPVDTIEDLVGELDRQYPGLATALEDTIYNFAVNDALILHHARQHELRSGDRVEVIPMIAGG